MENDFFDKITTAFFGIITILAVIITIRVVAIPNKTYYTIERDNNTIIVKEK